MFPSGILTERQSLSAHRAAKPQQPSHSVRNAGNNGDLSVAQVAISDAVRPDINTANSRKPRETFGSLPPRAKNIGAIDNSAHAPPVTNPQKSSRAFSATTISVKCEEL